MNTDLEAIKTILEDIALPGQPSGDLEYQMIMDNERQHYQVVVTGWRDLEQLHGIIVQIDIKDNLLWVR
jgi:hypothetical protein